MGTEQVEKEQVGQISPPPSASSSLRPHEGCQTTSKDVRLRLRFFRADVLHQANTEPDTRVGTRKHQNVFGFLISDEVCGIFLGWDAEHELLAEFPLARQTTQTAFSRRVVTAIETGGDLLPLRFRGPPFQCRVWNAIMQIPQGQVESYKDLAVRANAPSQARARPTRSRCWSRVTGSCQAASPALVKACSHPGLVLMWKNIEIHRRRTWRRKLDASELMR